MSKNKEILTEELLTELLSKPKVDDFINANELQNLSLYDYLNQILIEKDLHRNEVIRKTHINETHAYQIFSGQRKASRDKIFQLAFAMGLNIKECNRLLHCAGVSTLYCKNRRDSIIIFCLKQGCSVDETNDTLYNFNEDTL